MVSALEGRESHPGWPGDLLNVPMINCTLPLGQAEMIGRARSVLAHFADGMGVIHHDRRPVPLGQTTKSRAGGIPVAPSMLKTPSIDDELARLRINRFQAVLQGCHIIVGQPQELSRREETSFGQAGMVAFCPPG